MKRKNVNILVTVDLDPIPGAMHEPTDAVRLVAHLLNTSVEHYNPRAQLLTDVSVTASVDDDERHAHIFLSDMLAHQYAEQVNAESGEGYVYADKKDIRVDGDYEKPKPRTRDAKVLLREATNTSFKYGYREHMVYDVPMDMNIEGLFAALNDADDDNRHLRDQLPRSISVGDVIVTNAREYMLITEAGWASYGFNPCLPYV